MRRGRGSKTAAVTCNYNSELTTVADVTIVAEVGPEVVLGSTRMKAGSAQKMILNMITTGAMTRLGYVYENLMVNVHMKNSKLVERGLRILKQACNVDQETAIRTMKASGKECAHRHGDVESRSRQAGSGSQAGKVGRKCAPRD